MMMEIDIRKQCMDLIRNCKSPISLKELCLQSEISMEKFYEKYHDISELLTEINKIVLNDQREIFYLTEKNIQDKTKEMLKKIESDKALYAYLYQETAILQELISLYDQALWNNVVHKHMDAREEMETCYYQKAEHCNTVLIQWFEQELKDTWQTVFESIKRDIA